MKRKQSRRSCGRESGLYLVEFALVAGVFFLMLFGAIEVARLMFTWSALDAITQRGARVAAVCPMNDTAVGQIAIFGNNGGSVVVPDITAANVRIRYLTAAGNIAATRGDVIFVEASIQNFTHQMLIPETVENFIAPLVTAPPFTTTVPAESLGRHPGGNDYC